MISADAAEAPRDDGLQREAEQQDDALQRPEAERQDAC
jgi:hypothetical protein